MNITLPPIYRHCRRLLLHTEQVVLRFSRCHKYTVGADLRRQTFTAMRRVHLAVYDRAQAAQHVRALVWHVDAYKLTLQLAIDVGAFAHGKAGAGKAKSPGFAAFETAALLAAQIGKQCVGWLKVVGGASGLADRAAAGSPAAGSAGAQVAPGAAGPKPPAARKGARMASPSSLSERTAPVGESAVLPLRQGGSPSGAKP